MLTRRDAVAIIEAHCSLDDLTHENFGQAVAPMIEAMRQGALPHFSTAAGCSKGVFIFSDSRVVIKTPFRAYRYGRIFRNSRSRDGWDYCQREADLYALAESCGLGDVFAKTRYMKHLGSQPVYAQDFVRGVSMTALMRLYGSYSPMFPIETSDFVFCNATRFRDIGFNDSIAGCLHLSYGAERTLEIASFVETHGIGRDWHHGNFGENERGQLIFCDYTGFND